MSGSTDRTLTIFGDQPIVALDSGGRPTMYFVNYLQRLTSFVGHPSSSAGGGAPPSLQQQITNVNSQIAALTDIASGGVGGKTALTTYQLRAMQDFLG